MTSKNLVINRSVELESVRGIAAFIVLLWHLSLGFFPVYSGIFNNFDVNNSLKGSLGYLFINGSAAVVLFFVLSGYVLSRSFFLTGNYCLIRRNILKRLPRLASLTLLACLFSYSLFYLKMYRFEEAALITGSAWLSKFGYAYIEPFSPALPDAIWQGLYRTFFYGESYYNSSMWTMKLEFMGSFMVFGLAAALGAKNDKFYPNVIFLMALLLAATIQNYFVNFVAGAWLAWLMSDGADSNNHGYLVLILMSMYLFGYSGDSVGAYRFVPLISEEFKVYLWMVASLMMLIGILKYKPAKYFLHKRLLVILGRLSFPLYLLHVPVLCSFGCLIFLEVNKHNTQMSAVSAVFSSVIITLGLSALLMRLGDYFIKLINSFINEFLKVETFI